MTIEAWLFLAAAVIFLIATISNASVISDLRQEVEDLELKKERIDKWYSDYLSLCVKQSKIISFLTNGKVPDSDSKEFKPLLKRAKREEKKRLEEVANSIEICDSLSSVKP